MAPPAAERVEGPANAQATLRLFGQPESSVRVTLFRDHTPGPYCQKVWLWLEFRRIPWIRRSHALLRPQGAVVPWFHRECSRHLNWMGVSDRRPFLRRSGTWAVGVPMGDRRVRAA